MTFDLSWYSVPKEEEDKEEETVVYGIPGNPELERIIPGKFHSFVNEIINDYKTLPDEEFWKKYNLKESGLMWRSIRRIIKIRIC